MLKKRQLAGFNCQKAGYRKRTAPYYQCMRALIAQDRERTRARADNYARLAAEHRGMCMDRTTFRVSRCIEI